MMKQEKDRPYIDLYSVEELRRAAWQVVQMQDIGHLADPGLHEGVARLRWALEHSPGWNPSMNNDNEEPITMTTDETVKPGWVEYTDKASEVLDAARNVRSVEERDGIVNEAHAWMRLRNEE